MAADNSFDIVCKVDMQEVTNALDQTRREVVKLIKGTKLKVQASIQGDQVRVSGKNKDDLQTVMRMLRETDLGIDMQFTNYR